MRKIASHVWVRLAVIALLVPLIWGCVTHIFGILILSENHALIEEGTGAEEEFTASLMQRDIRRIKQAYLYPEAGNETVQNDIQINLRERFKPESSNFLFTLYDTDHNVLQMNELVSDEDAKVITVQQLTDNTTVKTISRSFADEKSALAFEKQYRDQTAPGFDTTNIQWEWKDSNEIQVTITSYPVVKCTVNAALRNPMTVKDRYYYSIYGFRMLIRYRTWLLISTPFMVVAAVLLLIFLIYGVGHKGGREELVASWTDKIPFDLFAALLLFIAFLPRFFHIGSLAAAYIEEYLTGIMLYSVMKLIRILLLLWLVLSNAAFAYWPAQHRCAAECQRKEQPRQQQRACQLLPAKASGYLGKLFSYLHSWFVCGRLCLRGRRGGAHSGCLGGNNPGAGLRLRGRPH